MQQLARRVGNLAGGTAARVLWSGGDVIGLRRTWMPKGVDLAAILRYKP